eukprot:gnl/TRDRNA2_/TRDRNA2_174030_c4_seq1.p1 gnl/TRDRNA2_/TRDRNA2_174030_c4~~gnl/TRDRNA2_/TRDRNA2_174030_c4_seq1.p1  ORF type:complete len:103 (-),score=3.29 gnl/TRDRNA2_/TRDRNA2_174030_c4_seq1:264-572(-)
MLERRVKVPDGQQNMLSEFMNHIFGYARRRVSVAGTAVSLVVIVVRLSARFAHQSNSDAWASIARCLRIPPCTGACSLHRHSSCLQFVSAPHGLLSGSDGIG